jgi:hypothetical protein
MISYQGDGATTQFGIVVKFTIWQQSVLVKNSMQLPRRPRTFNKQLTIK